MQPIFRLFLVLSVTACCLLPAGNAVTHAQKSINSSKNKLADVNKKIDRQKKKIRKVKKKEALVITTLNKIEKQLLSENREVETVNKKITNIHSTIRDVRRKIDGLQQETTQKENYLKKRLRALYKYYRRSGIRILLSASSYNELLKQEKLLSTIL
ncbi:MAG: hypothetical protein GY868_03960, partial [Deltaproteobacteria bacterium]|nr:hypothetical protein [Deltaproteobacteria bacterium]